MSETKYQYQFKETQDQRWAIYLQDRLLATVGNYEACQSINERLNRNLSYQETIKATITFKKAINKSLTM
ncbi:MAG: hypothetical protein AAF298_05205 [Cyanobacteria bacterium P01_A01_bin.40]